MVQGLIENNVSMPSTIRINVLYGILLVLFKTTAIITKTKTNK